MRVKALLRLTLGSVMKVSTSTNSKDYFQTKIKEYLRASNKWFFETPERALNQAYDAVMIIKSIEDEHFNGNTISADSINRSDNITSYLQADIEQQLSIAKLRLAEFKASRLFLGISNSVHLKKLRIVDEVLSKHTVKNNSSSSLVPLSKTVPINSKKVDSQLHSPTVEVINVKTVSDKTSFLSGSISRTINRVKRDLDPESEAEVINKFRRSRTKTTTAVRFIVLLALVPLLTQQLSKYFLIGPIVDQIRGGNETQIFLNSEMKESALHELQSFEEDLKFESLIYKTPQLSSEAMEEQVKYKAAAIAEEYHNKGDSAISNVFADLLGLVAFGLLIFTSRREIIILKSFMDDIVHGLSDSAKAFIIILFTDIFVGFHSPHGWEVILEGLASHLGLPADRNLIFLFIATFPVILDSIFKFWIFRYMTMLSPSAVATYRNMNE